MLGSSPRLASPRLATLICMAGRSARPTEEVGARPTMLTAARGAESPWPGQLHAFGTVFSEGQSLRHEFIVRNPLDHPVRLIRGMALTPCCSSIGPLPDSIPPRGEVKIPTSFNPPRQSGSREVRFLIETDSGPQNRIQLALQAQLVATWEIDSLTGGTATLPLKRSGKLCGSSG